MQLLVNIVVLASIYALIACGDVLIYRVSRVLNLAHGELMMLGGYRIVEHGLGVFRHPVGGDRSCGGAERDCRNSRLRAADAKNGRGRWSLPPFLQPSHWAFCCGD